MISFQKFLQKWFSINYTLTHWMQYCQISKCLKSSISENLKLIAFAKIVMVREYGHIILLIDRKGLISVKKLATDTQIFESRLLFEGNLSTFLLEVKEDQGIICFLTVYNLYLISWEDFLEQIEKKETNIKVNKAQLQASNIDVPFETWSNKMIKIITFQNKKYMKLAGRANKKLQYCYCSLDMKLTPNILFSYDQQVPNQKKLSIHTLDSDLLIYPVYTNKSKPLKVTQIKFYPYPQSNKGADSNTTELTINHFFKELTILQIFMANSQVLCLIGNNSFEQEVMSVMIVFNIKEKYTLNYLQLNQVRIEKVFIDSISQYQYNGRQKSLIIEAFEVEPNKEKQIRYYQLRPESFHKQENKLLQGSILTTDNNFIITVDGSDLKVYPKVHKWTLYSKILSYYQIDKSLIGMAIQLLK